MSGANGRGAARRAAWGWVANHHETREWSDQQHQVDAATVAITATLLKYACGPRTPRTMARRIPPHQREQARNNRRNPTKPERLLWYRLNRNQLGVHFRRQYPIGPYVVDFAAIQARLVIELDGLTHHDTLSERARETYLEDRGWRVLRFRNEVVLTNIDRAVQQITTMLKTHRS